MMILMKETAQNPIQTSNKYNTTDAGLSHHNICFTNNRVHENNKLYYWFGSTAPLHGEKRSGKHIAYCDIAIVAVQSDQGRI